MIAAQDFGIIPDETPEPLMDGHINSTYKVTSRGKAYVLQSLSPEVFREPVTVMDNISAVAAAFASSGEKRVGVPGFLTSCGRNYTVRDGTLWRMYPFITPEITERPDYLSGLAFGTFIRVTQNLRLRPVINGFHDFRAYLARLRELAPEHRMTVRLEALGKTLSSVFTPDIPLRTIHGDAKPDNVLTGKKCTVIDLDTAMNGYAALDFGDLTRSLGDDAGRFREAANGFAEGLHGLLTHAEVGTLYYGLLWTSGELAARYLADYISGDGYFKGKTPAQRLGRALELSEQLELYSGRKQQLCSAIRAAFAEEEK